MYDQHPFDPKLPPEVETKEMPVMVPVQTVYQMTQQATLNTFAIAVAGGVVGMLLTLLFLFFVNGGTLNFATQTELSNARNYISALEQNVRQNTQNIQDLNKRFNISQEAK